MGRFGSGAEVEILPVSGALRVTIRPNPHWFFLLFQGVLLIFFSILCARDWATTSFLKRVFEVVVLGGAAVAWFEQFSGSCEVVEIGAQQIRITRETLGWQRTSEYVTENCWELDYGKEEGYGLEFRLGRLRTISFAKYISKQQATDILDAVNDQMPDVASRLLASLDVGKHFATLGLSEGRQ